MWNKIVPTKNICDYHRDIEDKANELCKIRESDYEDPRDLLSAVQDIVNDILESVQYATQCGINMENRLQDYRDTIEGLGYKRVKKE